MKRDPLERLLHDRLADHDPTVDGEAAWAAFERLRTPPPRRRRPAGWWWWTGFGGLLLVALSIGGYYAYAPSTQFADHSDATPLTLVPNPVDQFTAITPKNNTDLILPQTNRTDLTDQAIPTTNSYTSLPTHSSTFIPTDLPTASVPAQSGAGAGGGQKTPTSYPETPPFTNDAESAKSQSPDVITAAIPPRHPKVLDGLAYPDLMPLPGTKPGELSLAIASGTPLTKPQRRLRWEFGLGQGYGTQSQQYTNTGDAQLRELRNATEQGLDVWQSDAFLRMRAANGWFVQTGLFISRAETRGYQLKESTEQLDFPNTVVERIRERDGSFTEITATVGGERYQRTEKRIYYQDLRFGLQLGIGRSIRLGKHGFDAALLGIYQPNIRFKGNVVDGNGNFRTVDAVDKPGYHTALHLDYHLPRLGDMQPRIGFFAGRDLNVQLLNALELRRNTAGLRISMNW